MYFLYKVSFFLIWISDSFCTTFIFNNLLLFTHPQPANPVYFKLPGKKKPRSLVLGFDLRAWQFPTFAWQTATLSSALSGFTSEFGMGSGGSRSLWSPSKQVSLRAFWLSTVFGVLCTPLEICNNWVVLVAILSFSCSH